MTNDEIVQIVCDIKNLSIDKSFPINECGERTDEDFDRRFRLDRTYQREFFNFKKQIRFVIYPTDNYISISICNMFISNIFMTSVFKPNEGKKIWVIDRKEKVTLDEIILSDRNNKINKIRNANKIKQ